MPSLSDLLLEPTDRLIAIAGAGGKTSLMFLLAHALKQRGHRVITTTTTRIRRPRLRQSETVLLYEKEKSLALLDGELARCGHVTLASHTLPGDKLAGLDGATLEKTFFHSAADRMIIEADGARGLSLKAPGDREPVVPEKTDLFIALAGVDIIGRPLTSAHVFRPELIAALTGLCPGDAITVESVARLATHPLGMLKGCPQTARSCILFNKTDIPGGSKTALAIINATHNLAGRRPDTWVYGSIRTGTAISWKRPTETVGQKTGRQGG